MLRSFAVSAKSRHIISIPKSRVLTGSLRRRLKTESVASGLVVSLALLESCKPEDTDAPDTVPDGAANSSALHTPAIVSDCPHRVRARRSFIQRHNPERPTPTPSYPTTAQRIPARPAPTQMDITVRATDRQFGHHYFGREDGLRHASGRNRKRSLDRRGS